MKKVIRTSVVLWAVMSLASACSKKNESVDSNAVFQALSQSVFNPGETVSQVGALAFLTDGGYIAPPPGQDSSSTGTTGEGGSIPGPVSDSSTVLGGTDTGSVGLPDSSTVIGGTDTGSIGQPDSSTVIGGTDTGSVGQPDSSTVIGGTDTGSVCPSVTSTCACHPKTPSTKIKFQLRRACSIKRSNSKSLFFEEAKNPILSIEAVNNSGFLAMPGFYQGSKAFSLASVSLKGVDLMKGKYSGQAALALAAFKKAKGWFWGSTYVDLKVCEDSNQNGFCYDEPLTNQLAIDVPDVKAGSIPRSLQINVFSGRSLTKSNNPSLCESQYSPLVFDLKGNGFEFVGPESGVSFDITDSGTPIPTGWIYSKDDALLVRDLNGSRKIESGAELFGNATRLPSGERAINGFEALRALDSDSNGYITSRDKAWSELRLWIDSNHDGVSQLRELINLDRAGIESISLGYVSVMEVDPFGNQTRERSTFIRRTGGKRHVLVVSDVWFNSFTMELRE
ncbi:MAG: hypothetical protein ACKN9V_06375 [Pseudomonadota bacterium]